MDAYSDLFSWLLLFTEQFSRPAGELLMDGCGYAFTGKGRAFPEIISADAVSWFSGRRFLVGKNINARVIRHEK